MEQKTALRVREIRLCRAAREAHGGIRRFAWLTCQRGSGDRDSGAELVAGRDIDDVVDTLDM